MEATKILLVFITLNIFSSCTEADSFGFSIDLIHRDSMFSPYFNPSNTHYDNLRNSIRHSMARSIRHSMARRNSIRHSMARSTDHSFTPNLASSSETIQSPLTAVPAEYLMKISVGTPPRDLLAVADTGSDLVWTQCQPCTNCYQQDAPLFNPQKSSTYKNIQCQSNACQSLPSASCDGNKCTYQVSYGDKSFSRGDLSSESFTFESTSGTPVVFPNIAFGCGHSNGGKFQKYTNGIVGLGNGQFSIVNQLSDTVNGKFSYCLVPVGANMTSKVSFGSNAVVSGPGVQTTPFYTREDTDTFYYLNLESVSVGKANVKFETNDYAVKFETDDYAEKASAGNGNIIIDSGTTITFVPSDFYQQLEDEFKSSLSLTPIETQAGSVFSLCYQKEDGYEDKVPTVTFHFTGADVELGVLNTLLEVQEGVVCLSMVPATDDLGAIFGNLQQMNYLVGYDLVSKTVSFKKSDCTQL